MNRPGRFLLYLLVAAHVAVGAAMIALSFENDLRLRTPYFEWQARWFVIACFMGLSFAQTALTVWWAVMGKSVNWVTRAAVCIVVVTIWIRAFSAVPVRFVGPVICLYVGFAVVILWLLVPWRLLNLVRDYAGPRWQFDLRQMLLLLLAVSCTGAVVQSCIVAGGHGQARTIGLVSISGGVTAVVAVWMSHRPRRVIWRAIVAMETIVFATLLMAWRPTLFPDWWQNATVLTVEALVIAATMAVFHIAARQPAGAAPHSEPVGEKAALRGPEFG